MRGLKLQTVIDSDNTVMSHLLQMRGLKPALGTCLSLVGVASFTDAWIETCCTRHTLVYVESHLLQMRGLKPLLTPYPNNEKSVASFTDAWIET